MFYLYYLSTNKQTKWWRHTMWITTREYNRKTQKPIDLKIYFWHKDKFSSSFWLFPILLPHPSSNPPFPHTLRPTLWQWYSMRHVWNIILLFSILLSFTVMTWGSNQKQKEKQEKLFKLIITPTARSLLVSWFLSSSRGFVFICKGLVCCCVASDSKN